MSDLQLLFLILAALYLWECACWVPRGSKAFHTWLGRRWRSSNPGTLLGNQRGGFVLAAPLPPLGFFLTAGPLPFALAPDGLLVCPAVPALRLFDGETVICTEAFNQISAEGKKVRFGRAFLFKASSPYLARSLVGKLRSLSKLPTEARAQAIHELLRGTLDTQAAEQRLADFKTHAGRVRVLANGLFGYLFMLVPVVFWSVGFRSTWPFALLGLIGLTTSIAILFRTAHRQFYPGADDELFSSFLIVLLSPATALRAHDLLSRPLFEAMHPLALARLLCRPAQFRELAREAWLDAFSPPSRPAADLSSDAERIAAFARASWQGVLKEYLRTCGLVPADFEQVPEPADDTCRSYCPRCLVQFTLTAGTCPDCAGQRLVPLVRTASAAGK
jgi:hypothetical protein